MLKMTTFMEEVVMEISNSPNMMPIKWQAAMMGKMKDNMKLEGEAAMKLIESANLGVNAPLPSGNVGTIVNTTA